MAKVVKEFPRSFQFAGKNDKYLDGRVWELSQEEVTDIGTFRPMLYKRARFLGKKVHISKVGNLVYVQAVSDDKKKSNGKPA